MEIPNDPIGDLSPDMDTVPKYFVKTAEKFGDSQVAMRKKNLGIWQEYTWADSYQQVHDFCLGLVSLGLKHNDKVCIIGDNDPEYFWAEIATQAAGGVTIGIFTDANPQELTYLITNSDAMFLIAHDQEQCDKAMEIREDIPNVKKVIYWDEQSLWGYDDPWLMSFKSVQALGQAYTQTDSNAFEELVNQGHSDDIAILSYTSGTTSLPKGAMIQHRNLIYGALHAAQVVHVNENDDYVSFSPLAWITEQAFGLTRHVIDGIVINFPETAETVQQDIREVAPVILLFPSRLWESIVSSVQARMVDSSWFNKFLYRLFLQIGYKIADIEAQGKTPHLGWQLLRFIGEFALFAPLRDKLGLSKIRFAFTSGSSLSPDALRFFRAIRVGLYQLYGSTEGQGHTMHQPNDVRFGTVGKPFPTVQVRIADDNEIQVKSRSVFHGYYKGEDKTEEAFTDDGWFKTGDAGYVDDQGHLIYLDRMKDMIRLSGGDSFSPQYIEGRLKFSPYIQDVMAVGSFDMPYVSAIMTLNFDNVARWAEKRSIAFTTLADLSQRPEISDLIMQDIYRTNESLPAAGRIKRFVILPRIFDPDEEELTRTRKIRRRYMEQKYGDILTAIYDGDNSTVVRSEVRYRDGRVGHTETECIVWDVEKSVIPA